MQEQPLLSHHAVPGIDSAIVGACSGHLEQPLLSRHANFERNSPIVGASSENLDQPQKQRICDSPISRNLSDEFWSPSRKPSVRDRDPAIRLCFDHLESKPLHKAISSPGSYRVSSPTKGGTKCPRKSSSPPKLTTTSREIRLSSALASARTSLGSVEDCVRWSPSVDPAAPPSPPRSPNDVRGSQAHLWMSSPPPVSTPPPPWAPKDVIRAQPRVGRTGTICSYWHSYMEDLNNRKLVFPEVQDSFPSMATVVEKLGEYKAANPGVLCADGNGGIVQGCMIQRTIMELLDGTSLMERLRLRWHYFNHKEALIRTTQALDFIVTRFHSAGDDPGEFMWMSRHCYIGQCEHGERPYDTIFATTTLKVCQLMFFMWLVMHKVVIKGYVRPPPAWTFGKVQEYAIRSWSDPSLFDERMKDPSSASLPIHPDWFRNSVPLISDHGAFKKHCFLMMELAKEDPSIFATYMHTMRSTLVHLQGSLRSHLDAVTWLQQKLLVGAASGFMGFVQWYYKSQTEKVC